jgi:hypothetical protein
MEQIMYLPHSDLAVPYYLKKASALISEITEVQSLQSIEEAISIYNIIRYIDDGLSVFIRNPDRKNLEYLINKFIESKSALQLLESIEDMNHMYYDDFWDFLVKYNIIQKTDVEIFLSFLSNHHPSIYPMLRQKYLINAFPIAIKDYFLSDPGNARFLIEQNKTDDFLDWKGVPIIPSGISNEEICQLMNRYIDSDSPALNYLEIISEMTNLSPKTRLAAKKRAEQEREKTLKNATLFNFGIEIAYQVQIDEVIESYKDGVLKLSYSINWIKKNFDNATLLNNFIYLFNFIDEQGRISLCFCESESGVLERFIGLRRKDRYPESVAYFQKNQAALLKLHTYNQVLSDNGKSIEMLIDWFFKDYLKNEFGILDFQVDLPSTNLSCLDKCKLIVPEIERIIKQYQMFIDDERIDLELLELYSNKLLLSLCGSLLKDKYCYIKSKECSTAMYYFYSDQCMLNYDSKAETSYNTFANRIVKTKPKRSDFEEYQQSDLDWLVSKGYLEITDESVVTFKNIYKVAILGEIFHNGCICYYSYSRNAKAALDMMILDGSLKCGTSLFSEPEQDYIDFHLNRHKYINSLDLRNKYTHGSHAGRQANENETLHDYLQLLKIVVCIVLKINDELCRKNILSKSTET